MKRGLILVGLLVSMGLLAACEAEKVEVLKSPCASLDDGPCGPKRPVNGNLNLQS